MQTCSKIKKKHCLWILTLQIWIGGRLSRSTDVESVGLGTVFFLFFFGALRTLDGGFSYSRFAPGCSSTHSLRHPYRPYCCAASSKTSRTCPTSRCRCCNCRVLALQVFSWAAWFSPLLTLLHRCRLCQRFCSLALSLKTSHSWPSSVCLSCP